MKIGAQLQRQRKLHGMSQGDLAKELKISRQSVSKWENGTTLPSFTNIVNISEIFGISLDELIKSDEELMIQLETNNRKISKTWFIVIVSFIIAGIIMSGLRLLNLSDDGIDNFFSIPEVVSFTILIFNINWRKFNLAINQKVVVWGIIWLVLYLIPLLNDFVAGFIAGYSGR